MMKQNSEACTGAKMAIIKGVGTSLGTLWGKISMRARNLGKDRMKGGHRESQERERIM